MPGFVHLNVHSEYSPLDGVASVDSLCRAARDRGFQTLALTDLDGIYGAVVFQQSARRHGLKPIIGVELNDAVGRAVLLARTSAGYANLCRIVSARHEEAEFSLRDAVARHRDGLVVISDTAAYLADWRRYAREDLYVEITPGAPFSSVCQLSRGEDIPVVATNRVRFVDAADYATYPVLQAIRLNTTLSRTAGSYRGVRSRWLMPASVFAGCMSDMPEALENSLQIAAGCEFELNSGANGFTKSAGGRAALAKLSEKTWAGARRRYREITPAVRARLERELNVIGDKNLTGYFLLVEEITRDAPITCGRGSGAGSIVCYCLAITDVDPIEHDLSFDRFLSTERTDPPDIDIDIPWDERARLLGRIVTRYGRERVALVANHNRLGWSGAVRETAKVYGIAPDDITRVTARLLKQREVFLLSEHPGARAWAADLCRRVRLTHPWPEILQTAMRVEGRFRNISLHCGGAVIVPDDIRARVPVQKAANGAPMLQWDKEQVEAAGLVKVDLLGNRSLSVIRDVLAAVRRHRGTNLDYRSWDPHGDAETEALVRNGTTIGCFNVESPAVRLLLRKLWLRMPPERRAAANFFNYLVMVSSLVRPAAISMVSEFVRRAHAGSAEALHPSVDPLLHETHGLMLYQDDVARVATRVAGFTPLQAEELRRALNRKQRAKRLKQFERDFLLGAEARGIPRPVVDYLWRMTLGFAGYSFCKAHAASYARVSLRCAYLKAHYPAEFMAAVISHEGGYYPTFAYISEARRMGLRIDLPDINESEWQYRAAERIIRMGFMHIRGIRKGFVDRMLLDRAKSGRYRSLADFWARTRPGLAQCRLLIKAGCFDGIAGGLTRPGLLWRAYALQDGDYEGGLPNPREYDDEQKLAHEIESFGFLVSRHPLELYGGARQTGITAAADLPRHVGKPVRVLGWLITEKLTQTKNGHAMEFVTFEDVSAIYEAIFFPETYRRVWHTLAPNQPFILTGVVGDDLGAVTLNVREIRRLDVPERRCYGGSHGGQTCEEGTALGSRFPAAGAFPGILA